MDINNQPIFIAQPFCSNGVINVDYNIIPNTSPDETIATFENGFPVAQSIKPVEGGSPVTRQEFNGINRMQSENIAFLQAGGQYVFNENNEIGYQAGAILYDPTTGLHLKSTKNNNKDNYLIDRTFIGSSWTAIGSNNRIGTFRYSMDDLNVQDGDGIWFLCNGQAVPEAYVNSRAWFIDKLGSPNVPNLIGRVLAMQKAETGHPLYSYSGVEKIPVPLKKHTHTATHVHTHAVVDPGHNHYGEVYGYAANGQTSNPTPYMSGLNGPIRTSTNITIYYSGTGITISGANNPNVTVNESGDTDDSGEVSIIQPTFYANIFIFVPMN